MAEEIDVRFRVVEDWVEPDSLGRYALLHRGPDVARNVKESSCARPALGVDRRPRDQARSRGWRPQEGRRRLSEALGSAVRCAILAGWPWVRFGTCPPMVAADTISPGRVGAGEQVPQRPSPAQGEPDPPPVLGPVVQQVAPLAQGPDVAVPPAAMRRIVVEVGRRQHHLGRAHRRISRPGQARGPCGLCPSRQVCCCSSHQRPSPRWRTIAPCGRPQAWQRPLARTKRDPVADLLPVDRVEPEQLRLDRHGRVPAQASMAAVLARGRWR